jgi:outer membrane lipoprotein-sorting protein
MKGCLILVWTFALSAQGVPDAASILESSRHAFDRYQSYQFQFTVTVINTLPSGARNPPARIIASVAGMSPGKVHIDSALHLGGISGVMRVVSDGQMTWIYEAESNSYKKQAEESRIDSLLDLAGAWSGSLPDDAGGFVGTVREESLDADGEKRDCWLVERTAPKVGPPGNFHYQLDDIKWTSWIDKISGINWRTTIIGRLNGGTPDAEVTIAKTEPKLNLGLPDSLFIFTPPLGSRETPYFQSAASTKALWQREHVQRFRPVGIRIGDGDSARRADGHVLLAALALIRNRRGYGAVIQFGHP